VLEYTAADGEEGFPGRLQVRATFRVSATSNELSIQYDAATDKPTVVNLTNHAFFNLSGDGQATINDHLLEINSDLFSPVDEGLIPQGKPRYDIVFDFAQMHAIGQFLEQKNQQLEYGKGYDHNFLLHNYQPGTLRKAATAFSPTSGISMELATTEPGLQFYGGNFLQGKDRGKTGKPYLFRSLFCLEPQHFPNSPNDRNQPSTSLRPGDRYVHISTYTFRNDMAFSPMRKVRDRSAEVAQQPTPERWTTAQADEWHNAQPWRVGANFVPAYAINQLEMFQSETFDTVAIERELALAAGIGMNTMRIFLHDLLWRQDAVLFKKRIDTVLRICQRHGITPMLVLFDSVWDGYARLGKQPEPVPGVHNSGWVKNPNLRDLADPTLEPLLEAYVYDIVQTFGQDKRVYAWDIWNEPDNTDDRRADHGMCSRNDLIARLLPKFFHAARMAQPMQPLTSGVWWGWEDWADDARLTPIRRIQLEESDVISFHCYADSTAFEFCIRQLTKYNRPIICTEYLARSMGSTFEKILPIGKKHRVDMINWGLVQGKTQTHFPWDSWQEPYTKRTLPIWHHEVFKNDGTPYRVEEVRLIEKLMRGK
jgi:galactose mutarotase-like enzyme